MTVIAPPQPDFQVLGAAAQRHAAVPALAFDVHVSEPGGRQVHLLALSVQLLIEPARRPYDDATRERLVELFGPPERWAMTSRALVWAQADVLVPSFTGATTFRLPVTCSYDHELAVAKYLASVRDGGIPLAFNFNGTIHYRDEDGRLQMTLVPWSCSAEFRLPADVWQAALATQYPNAGWVPLRTETLDELGREKARRGMPNYDLLIAQLLAEAKR